MLARCNGTVAIETSRGVGLVEQGGSWTRVAVFVCGLLAAILLFVGIAFLVEGKLFALGLVTPGVLSALAVVALLRYRKRLATRPLATPWLEIDLQARVVIQAGRPPVPLDQLRLERVFQAGSSSKALALRGVTKIVLARGNPFGDEVDGIEQVLRARGVR